MSEIIILIAIKDKPQVQDTIHYYLDFAKSNNVELKIQIVDFGNNSDLKKTFESEKGFFYQSYFLNTFNKSLAINIGLYKIYKRVKTLKINILICDADVLINPISLKKIIASNKTIVLDAVTESIDKSRRKAYGIIYTNLGKLFQVNGYDSHYKGWGFEDHDIIHRLQEQGEKIIRYGNAIHISHGDNERVQHYQNDSLISMRQKNLSYYHQKLKNKLNIGTFLCDIYNNIEKYD